MQHRLNLESREVARKTLNIDTLKRFAVPVAPASEMIVADERVSSLLAWAGRVRTVATSATQDHAMLDRAILAKAFRGALVPQDPADEPASALLARLRAEREQPTPAAPARKPRRKA
jgi:type I restriction enzyme S subunit